MQYRNKWLTYLFICLIITQCPSYADEAAQNGRRLLASTQHAVIKVDIVIRFKLVVNGNQRQQNEKKVEATGTVLTPDGLTLMSLNVTDPGDLASKQLKRYQPGKNMDLESDVSDLKLILPDGAELPAKIVLRDKDLDLAFIQPLRKPAAPLACIDKTRTAAPDILDPVFVLNRLGKIAGRIPAVTMDRIQAVMNKPRPFYIPHISRDLGAAVFTPAGEWIGNILLRTVNTGAADTGAMVVILPAEDIIDVAGQAPEME